MSTYHTLSDAEMQVQVVVPPEIARANGSAVDMGCTIIVH